jgi:taurine dioxygenase
MTVEVTRLSGALGAEVRGVDLEQLDDDQFARVHALFLEHLVLLFPDQQVSVEAHIAFGRRFGELFIHPRGPNLDDHPEVFVLEGDRAVADHWHTDSTFEERPPLASILKMVVVPTVGGDTMWSNQYLAYERLSETMKGLLDHLTALHTLTTEVQPGRGDPITGTHPVVRVHPETGRRSLFVNRSYTKRIVELSQGESDALLAYLFAFSEQPEFQCRYRWGAGTIAIWDNRCTQHCVVGDYDELRRIERVTPLGDAPRGVQ